MTPAGLLHSDICGSMCACHSPQLFAAYRVLLRPLMPRHSPCALCSLTISLADAAVFLRSTVIKRLRQARRYEVFPRFGVAL